MKPLIKLWLRCWCAMVGRCCVIVPHVAVGIRTSGTFLADTWKPGRCRERLLPELEEELGIWMGEPGPELASVAEAGLAVRIWLVERWTGNPVNVSPEEHDDLGWFSASEAEELRLAHTSYLYLIRDTLSGSRPQRST